jgi:hypothetical protein
MLSRWAVGGLFDTATAYDLADEALRLTGSTPTWLVNSRALPAWAGLPDYSARLAIGSQGKSPVFANPTPLTDVLRRHAPDDRVPIEGPLGAAFDAAAARAWSELLARGACLLCVSVSSPDLERSMASTLIRRVPGAVRIFDVATPRTPR